MLNQTSLNQLSKLLEAQAFRQLLAETQNSEFESEYIKASALLYRAEALVATGDYSTSSVDEALQIIRTLQVRDLLPWAKFLLARIQLIRGELTEAEESINEAFVFYKAITDLRGMASSLNLSSHIAFQLGDYLLAKRQATRSMSVFDDLGKCGEALSVKLNLVTYQLRAGELRQTLKSYVECTESAARLLKGATLYNYHHRGALIYAQLGDFESALRHVREASILPPELRRERFRHLEIFGYVQYLNGDLPGSRKSLRQAEALAGEIAVDSVLVSQVCRLRADLEFTDGNVPLALDYATKGLAAAEKQRERLEIAACWRVFAQVAAHDNKQDKARDWFRRAIDLFNQISSRYELAVTRYLAARSGVFEPAESIALLFLAKEYFESEQVTPYIDKVKVALQTLHRPTLPMPPVKPSSGSAPVQIITANKTMSSVLELARNLAPTDMTVLLTGETGTGKDLLARYVYEHSGCTGAFVSQNVTTLPAAMIESELFGHRKGAYTGAERDRPGLIRQAENGTLFLNEIGEASPELQAKLLEVLETRRVRRVGDDTDQPVAFRLIVATNADLRECARSGKFRADLYHRLNQATLTLPPLRERLDDVELLVRHFLQGAACCSNHDAELDALVQALGHHDWPGNVRELENTIKRLWVMQGYSLSRMAGAFVDELAISDDVQLATVLAECGGNKSKAARRLGISEGTIRYRLKQGDL